MHIVLHTGAHFTEEERLMKCLLRNKRDFSRRGLAVPGPKLYRGLLNKTIAELQMHTDAEAAREKLLDAVLEKSQADRILLSNPHLFAFPRATIGQGKFYPWAADRLKRLAHIFPNEQIELFFALRNPATFLPWALKRSPVSNLQRFLGYTDPLQLRWSDTLNSIREQVPQIHVTVWCNEDAPLIWSQIIRDMAGLNHGEKIIGGFDLLSEIMAPDGMKRFRTYLKNNPDMSELQKRRVIAAFLEKYVLEDKIEEELDIPGWTYPFVEQMTDAYDQDIYDIQRMPGIHMITP